MDSLPSFVAHPSGGLRWSGLAWLSRIHRFCWLGWLLGVFGLLSGSVRAAAPPDTAACRTGLRSVRVNIHFVQNAAGELNFGPADLPATRFDDDGYRWAQLLLWAANSTSGWDGNPPMKLPAPPAGQSNPPGPPKRIFLVLTGVYFDRVPAAADLNRTYPGRDGSYLFNTFGRDKATTLNIFVVNNVDSAYASTGGIASGIGPAPGQGGCWVKIMAPWQACRKAERARKPIQTAWNYGNILNHEIGHVFGLPHTFVEPWSPDAPDADGFADTPNNPRCWDDADCARYRSPAQPGSNNQMDYNQCQCALTPMQVARMNYTLSHQQAPLIETCGTMALTHVIFGLHAGATPVTDTYPRKAGPLSLNGQASVTESRFDLTIFRVGGRNARLTRRAPYHQSYTESLDYCTVPGVPYGGGEVDLSTLYRFRRGRTYRVRLRTYNAVSADSASVEFRVVRGGRLPAAPKPLLTHVSPSKQ